MDNPCYFISNSINYSLQLIELYLHPTKDKNLFYKLHIKNNKEENEFYLLTKRSEPNAIFENRKVPSFDFSISDVFQNPISLFNKLDLLRFYE